MRRNRAWWFRLYRGDHSTRIEVPMIYLDNNATTAIAPEVLEAMLPYLAGDGYGNPSSANPLGAIAREAVDSARIQTASLLGCDPDEIVFTSGGTESINTAVIGCLYSNGASKDRKRIITSPVEHPAMRATAHRLEILGHRVEHVRVDSNGVIDIDHLASLLHGEPAVVSVMSANNETGVVQPIAEIAKLARRAGCLVHSDAVQMAGKTRIDVREAGIDLLSVSGHKFHAPKGVGALFVRHGTRLDPLLRGGHQERGLRAGTENVASIVGFGRACELANSDLAKSEAHMGDLRDLLESLLLDNCSSARVLGRSALRVPNTSAILFADVASETLLRRLNEFGIFASSGSACSAEMLEPSHVLLAMGLTPESARSVVRFSLSKFTTRRDIESAAFETSKLVEEIKLYRHR